MFTLCSFLFSIYFFFIKKILSLVWLVARPCQIRGQVPKFKLTKNNNCSSPSFNLHRIDEHPKTQNLLPRNTQILSTTVTISKDTRLLMKQGLILPLLPEREKLFEKAITRSDIRQYRFAIPKKQAKKHFPVESASSKGALLKMEDCREGKVWQFKCKLWRSSQGYVLTREWSQFVKEKRLRAGDVVSFLRSTGPDKRLFIDWNCKPRKLQSRSTSIAAKHEVEQIGKSKRRVKLFGVNISTN